MSIEKSKRHSIDGQWIIDNEAKEFEYGYSNGKFKKSDYQRSIEMLAAEKIKSELTFNWKLEAQFRAFEIELNNTIRKIQSFTDKIHNIRDQIEIDIEYQLSNEIINR